ncbi:hypothetical protein AAEX37_00727 [Oligella sp. MSHR50489EDL]
MHEYEELDTLMGAYLNLDEYIIFGCDTLEEAVNCSVMEITESASHALLKSVGRFEGKFHSNLDEAFNEQFLSEINIGLVSDFFLRTVIKEHYPNLMAQAQKRLYSEAKAISAENRDPYLP